MMFPELSSEDIAPKCISHPGSDCYGLNETHESQRGHWQMVGSQLRCLAILRYLWALKAFVAAWAGPGPQHPVHLHQ
jgi:hypothetical protein